MPVFDSKALLGFSNLSVRMLFPTDDHQVILRGDHNLYLLLFVALWTVASQAPLSMGSPRQEYWSGLPFPTPEDGPNPGIIPASPVSPALASRFLTAEPPRGPDKTKSITVLY